MKKIIAIVTMLLTSNLNYAQNWNEIIKSYSSDAVGADFFGEKIAINGNYAIVGVRLQDSDTVGGDKKTSAGAAYIFKLDDGVWTEQQKLVASDRQTNDFFGFSVAIDSNYAFVGAYNESEDENGANTMLKAGSAYIFKHNNGVWKQSQKIVASDRAADAYFGSSISISGNVAAIGAFLKSEKDSIGNPKYGTGAAYIFNLSSGVWTQKQKILASDRNNNDHFGKTISLNGDYMILGTYYKNIISGQTDRSGAAYIFKQVSGVWKQQQRLVGSNSHIRAAFGYSVALDGEYAVVGAPYHNYNEKGTNPIDSAGAIFVFKLSSGVWTEQQKIVSKDRSYNDAFGYSVSIKDDHILVGAVSDKDDENGGNPMLYAGSAYIYKLSSGTWSMMQKIVASDRKSYGDEFGSSVAISGIYAMVGAPFADALKFTNTGAAYIYKYCINTEGIDTQVSCNELKWIDGKTYSSNNNTATFNLIGGNSTGCDSLVTLNFTLLPFTKGFDKITECDSFIWKDGKTYKSSNNTATFKIAGGNVQGCDSIVTLNLTINNPTTSIDKQTACNSFKWRDGKTYTTNNNNAKYTIVGGNRMGCDSVIALNLQVTTVNTNVTKSGTKLTADLAGKTYQWLDCNNSMAPIAGAKSQSFTTTQNGSFAVEITDNGCVDTSECNDVNTSRIIESNFENKILVYPNPNYGAIFIDLGHKYQKIEILITDETGKLIQNPVYSNKQILEINLNEPSGIYFIKVKSENKEATLRLIKN